MVVQRRAERPRAAADTTWDTAVTEIIPIVRPRREGRHRASKDLQVLHAPELDDLNDRADERPLELMRPVTAQPVSDRTVSRPTRAALATPSRGRHRPVSHRKQRNGIGANHSRLVVTGMAVGAVVAGASTMSPGTTPGDRTLTSPVVRQSAGIEIVPAPNLADSALHREELFRATAFAQERAQREAMLRRPRFAFPAAGIQTSAFGMRWGTLHGGLDIANAIGTPIYAAADGEVIAAGPTAGYGMWVKIRDADGTVTLYGHIDSTTVRVGDRVMAGDQVATMGNRGNSTGPHLHFEVHVNGSSKTDPTSWLRARGIDGR